MNIKNWGALRPMLSVSLGSPILKIGLTSHWTFSVDNVTNKKFRYLNGGYGVGKKLQSVAYRKLLV